MSSVWAGACHRPLLVGWEPWQPYHFADRDGQLTGFGVETLRLVAGRLGCRLEFRQRPWVRTLDELASGRLDVAMEALRLPGRERFAYFAGPTNATRVALWARTGYAPPVPIRVPDDLVRLGDVRLGVTRGFSYGPELDAWLASPPSGIHVEMANDSADNYRKLGAGHIDFLFGDLVATRTELEVLGMSDRIRPLSLTWHVSDAWFMLGRRSVSPELAARFVRAMDEVRRSAAYRNLLHKYGMPDALKLS